MISDKMGIKGKMTARVMELDELGNKLYAELLLKYGENRKQNLEYLEKRDILFKEHGHIKRHDPTWLRRLFNMPGREMLCINHNIVTDEGDALIADLMSETPSRNKVDNTNGHIEVGTGWTGTTPKTNTSCNTPTGTLEALDATYPKLKGAFGATDDNVTLYRATFEPGDLSVSGIDEVALLNATPVVGADCLAYAEVTPVVNMGILDTLQIDWEITYLGS